MDLIQPGEEALHTFVETVSPLQNYQNSGSPLEWIFPASPHYLTDLSQCYLKIALKVTKADGTPIVHKELAAGTDPWSVTDWDTEAGTESLLSCVNNFVNSQFSQIQVFFNSQLVENSLHYPYVSYLANLLSADSEIKSSLLAALSGWYPDEPMKFDEKTNTSFRQRINNMILNGRTVHFKTKLDLGVFRMSQLLPNHLQIKICAHPTSPDFSLLWCKSTKPTEQYKIQFSLATMECKRIKPFPNKLRELETKLSKSLVNYDFVHTTIRAHNLSSGASTYSVENLYTGQIPNLLMLVFLDNDAFHGQIQKNPYFLKHHDLSYCCIETGGSQYPSPRGFVCDESYKDCYMELFRCFSDFHGIKYEDFLGGSFVLPFNLEAAAQSKDAGVINAKIRFKTALTSTLTVLAIACTNTRFQIDHLRNVNTAYIP